MDGRRAERSEGDEEADAVVGGWGALCGDQLLGKLLSHVRRRVQLHDDLRARRTDELKPEPGPGAAGRGRLTAKPAEEFPVTDRGVPARVLCVERACGEAVARRTRRHLPRPGPGGRTKRCSVESAQGQKDAGERSGGVSGVVARA